MMPPETMLVSVVHAAVLRCDKVGDVCGCKWSVKLTEPLMMSFGFVYWWEIREHVNLSGLCSQLKPY